MYLVCRSVIPGGAGGAMVKFVFSKKATEIEKKIFIDNLTVCSKCQIDDEELAEFCGLLRKHEL